MHEILALDENRLYVENEKWQCEIEPGSTVKLGLVLEARRLPSRDRDFSFIIDACLVLQPEFMEKEIIDQARDEGVNTREGLILYAYEYHGGVPVNIDAVQPAKASCGFSSFVAESNIASLKGKSGDEMEVRHFKDRAEAMKFAEDFYAIYASGLFGFIDCVLDNPLPGGGNGRDRLRSLAKKLVW